MGSPEVTKSFTNGDGTRSRSDDFTDRYCDVHSNLPKYHTNYKFEGPTMKSIGTAAKSITSRFWTEHHVEGALIRCPEDVVRISAGCGDAQAHHTMRGLRIPRLLRGQRKCRTFITLFPIELSSEEEEPLE